LPEPCTTQLTNENPVFSDVLCLFCAVSEPLGVAMERSWHCCNQQMTTIAGS
jgi:hypothetical protein